LGCRGKPCPYARTHQVPAMMKDRLNLYHIGKKVKQKTENMAFRHKRDQFGVYYSVRMHALRSIFIPM
jgi:hypothetical protein